MAKTNQQRLARMTQKRDGIKYTVALAKATEALERARAEGLRGYEVEVPSEPEAN